MGDRILVTGGLGFMGAAFARRAVERGQPVVNVDLGTYAADQRRLEELSAGGVAGKLRTERVDVASDRLGDLVRRERPPLIAHFAAETHVTRSEREAERFMHSNVEGTRAVLTAAESVGCRLVVHVSTDEVYGPCSGPPFREEDKAPGAGQATSAYARSKALADDVARSFFSRVPVIVVRPSNCFGPWQHPEKAVARWVTRALTSDRIPVWGDGMHVRDWMFIDDAISGLDVLVDRGTPSEVYNLAPEGSQRPNVDIARLVAEAAGRSAGDVYLTEYDRPGHDRRYAIDATKVRALGWRPAGGLEARLAETVEWYRSHQDWWRPLVPEAEGLYADAVERGAT